MINIGIMVIALILVLGGAMFYFNQHSAASAAISATSCSDIQTTIDEGRQHLNSGETHTYQTNPPASGPHDPEPLPAGIYDVPTLATHEVHSLEHGYIIIHYNGIPSGEVQQLAELVRQDQWKIILAPLPTMAWKISLTAWDHLQTCEGVNVQAIRNFVNLYRDHGPEQTPM